MSDVILQVGITLAFCLIAGLGHLSYSQRWAWWIFNGILWLFNVACLGIAGLLGLLLGIALFEPSILTRMPARSIDALGFMTFALAITGIIGVLLMLPWSRTWLFKRLPGNPDSPLHRYAIMACMLMIAANGSFLLMITPADILELVRNEKNFIQSLLLMQTMLLTLTFAGVGLGITKNWRQAIERLGITGISWKGLGLCVAGSMLLFVVITLVDGYIMQNFFPETTQYGEEMARMLKLQTSLPVALLIFFALSLVIGTGEELFFRGLLQPAVGTFLSSALFAIIHIQYGLSPLLLVVFALGAFFAAVRKRYGVTPCILLHALYDFYNFTQVQLLT